MKKKTVTIIGAGLMGPGIATCSTLGGCPTILLDRTSDLAIAGVNKTRENLNQLLENELIDRDQADSAMALLQTQTDLKLAVKDSFLIIEAVSEKLSLKQELFQELDKLTTPDVIITSNTSGL